MFKFASSQTAVQDVIVLPHSNRGINYARQYILLHAERNGIARFIMSDDDCAPRHDDDVRKLFDLSDLPTIGMGAMFPFYGLKFGNETLRERNDPLFCDGGMGKRLFSLDTERALEVGGYDVRLHSSNGDNEIVRQAIKHGYTWYVHAGVQAINLIGRFKKGGINDLHNEDEESRKAAALECHRIIYEEWGPEYIAKPQGHKITTRWQKLMDDYIPDWKDRKNW